MSARDAMAALDAILQNSVPPELKAKGWVYRDPPGWFSAEYWTLFLSILGKGNYQLLTYSERQNGDCRGQMFVSPEGMANIVAYRNRDLPTPPEEA